MTASTYEVVGGTRCQQVGERAGSILWSSVEYPGYRPQNKNKSPLVYWQLQLNSQPWEWPPTCGDFICLSIRIGLGAWLKIKCRKTTVGSSPTSGTNDIWWVVQENGWGNWVYLIATFEYWIIRRMSSSLIRSFRYHTSGMTFNHKVRVSSPLSGLILRSVIPSQKWK